MRPALSPVAYEDALIVSDPHFGLLSRNAALSVEQKLSALQAILRYGARHRVGRLLLAGDTRDNRPNRRVVEYESHQARERLQDCGFPRRLLRGNHDWDLRQEEAEGLLGECEVIDGLARVDEESGVCVGHGHGYGLRRLRELVRLGVRRGLPPGALLESLDQDETLRRQLEESDRFTRRIDVLEEYSDLARGVGERLVAGFRDCRVALAEALRGSPAKGTAGRGRVADWLDFGPLLAAAELGAATGCWASVYGHYHTPLATVRYAEGQDGLRRPVAVADSGSFIQAGKPVTAVHARYPSLTLLRYDTERDEMVPWSEARVAA